MGLIIWLPFWMLRMLGAGDVKLFAAAGVWLGPWSALEAALLAAAVGGVLALGWLVWKRGAAGAARTLALWVGSMRATRSVHPVVDARDTLRLPYGLALSAGALIVGWVPGILL